MRLYDYGFSSYQLGTVAAAGLVLASVQVRGGTASSVPLALGSDLAYPVTEEEHLTMTVTIPASVAAPVVPGQVLGTARAYLDGVEVAAAPSAMLEPEAEESPGFWSRLFG